MLLVDYNQVGGTPDNKVRIPLILQSKDSPSPSIWHLILDSPGSSEATLLKLREERLQQRININHLGEAFSSMLRNLPTSSPSAVRPASFRSSLN
jgi:hypothetical protein